MQYITQADIGTLFNTADLVDSTDDQRTGVLDTTILNTIIDNCSQMCDALVSPTYQVPFTTVPAKIKQAALIFVAEALFSRRLVPEEKNPYTVRADVWRQILRDVGEKGNPLDYQQDRTVPPVIASTYKSVIDTNTW